MTERRRNRLQVIADATADRLVTCDALSALTGVSTRTIQRDIAALRLGGRRVDASAGRGGGYMLRDRQGEQA